MSQDKIKVGDRVQTTTEGVVVQGKVQSIYVSVTRGGPAPVFKVLVEKKDGTDVDDQYELDTPAHLWVSIDPPEVCEDCGDTHTTPFGTEVMNLFGIYQKAKDHERSALMVEIAKVFVANLKDTEMMIPESIHDLATKVEEAVFALNHLYEKVGRCIVGNIAESQRLKSVKDMMGGLGGVQVLNIQDLQNMLTGSKGGSSPLSTMLDFDKKKGGGHGGQGSAN